MPTTLERYRLTGGVEPLALSAELAAAVESSPLGLFTADGDLLATETAKKQMIVAWIDAGCPE
jgi:hypothetical protein